MRGKPWTSERIARLRKLWADGETAVIIAARLGGMSRAAVLGKIFRLRGDAAIAAIVAPAAQKSTRRVQQAGTASLARRRRRARHDGAAPSSPALGSPHKTLLELTNETCRWPHGRPGTARFFFCGAPEADVARGVPYCARHMRRAYAIAISLERGRASAFAVVL